jgi:two-component system response regulator (stage 0 sporulation protein A)
MKFQINGDQVILSRSELLQMLLEKTPEKANESIQEVQNENGNPKTLEAAITEYLIKRNFRRGIRGFEYIREAITICSNDRSMCFQIINLYREVAKKYDNATSSRVERAIRHAIETAYGDRVKPCNSEFIVTAADVIRLDFIARRD